nr:PCP reductase family protein [Nodosilinea sp. LEGE 07298]
MQLLLLEAGLGAMKPNPLREFPQTWRKTELTLPPVPDIVKKFEAQRNFAPLPMEWTADAEARLKEIPFFVRPAARKKIEKFAQEQGLEQITAEVYEAAKKQFG